MAVEFEDYSIRVTEALNEGALQGLRKAAAEIKKQAADNSRVATGQLRKSWDYTVDEGAYEATIGSPLENTIWEEFGTGEYAAHGDGRKGGWSYQDDTGKWHHTKGKRPIRTLQKAFQQKRDAVIKLIAQSIRDAMK